MPKKFSNIIVIDLDCTCWDTSQPPMGQQHETIEIGICIYNNKTGEIERPKSRIVKPLYSTISEYCTNLTGITQEKVDQEGISVFEMNNKIIKENVLQKNLSHLDLKQNIDVNLEKFELEELYLSLKENNLRDDNPEGDIDPKKQFQDMIDKLFEKENRE